MLIFFKISFKIILIFIIFSCSSYKEDYYTTQEANQKIILSFLVKDFTCGTTHKLTNLLPENARKEEVNACIKAISLVECSEWERADPSPILCKAIHFQRR
jgi:hypothetical protein